MQANGVSKTAKKSRNGCHECKLKRLKCDEEKPGCLQCKRRRKECPGYERKLRWSTKYEKSIASDNKLSENAVEALQSFVKTSAAAEPTNPDVSPSADDDHKSKTSSLDQLDHAAKGGLVSPKPLNASRTSVLGDDAYAAVDESSIGLDANAFSLGDWTSEDLGALDALDPIPCNAVPSFDKDSWLNDDVEDFPREQHQALSLSFPRASNGLPVLSLSRQLINQSTYLVEYWFTDVCQMFSAFDSEINPIRQMAKSSWPSSEPVYHTLNYMAATCLADTLPQVKHSVHNLAVQAMDAIKRATEAMRSGNSRPRFPTDLLFAIFAIGTSLVWTDTRQIASWLLSDARSILAEYEDKSEHFDRKTRQQLDHFQHALVYWEMLFKAVSDMPREPSKKTLTNGESEPSSPIDFPADVPSTPHPWTGTSSHAHATFGTVMELCRRSRSRVNAPQNLGVKALRQALDDIELAQRLALELRVGGAHIQFAPTVGTGAEVTNDDRTPLQHLVDAEEAYRLASLLQLYLAFPNDLTMQDSVSDTDGSWSEEGNNAQLQTVTLALQLVSTLERIPITSGTRCILPLAIISAAAGLEFIDPAPPPPPIITPMQMPNRSWTFDCEMSLQPEGIDFLGPDFDFDDEHRSNATSAGVSIPFGSAAGVSSGPISLAAATASAPPAAASPNADMTALHIRIAHARRLVLTRLNALHGSLPRRPVAVALKLVKAIWAEYDGQKSGQRGHWMDVMFRTGLWTLFG